MDQYSYTAAITHSKQTVVRLNQVLHDVSHKWKKILFAVVGFLFLMCGVAGRFDPRISTVLIALGCWSLLLINYSARTKAREMEQQLNGCYPEIHYCFGEQQIDMQIKSEHESVKYSSIVHWAVDRNYIYFFPSESSIFMIDRSTLDPDDFSAFQAFIRARCTVNWIMLGFTNMEKLIYAFNKRKS